MYSNPPRDTLLPHTLEGECHGPRTGQGDQAENAGQNSATLLCSAGRSVHDTTETQVVHPGGGRGRTQAAGSREATQTPLADSPQLLAACCM